MRVAVLDAVTDAARFRERVDLYGPEADLSGVDTSQAVDVRPASPLMSPPAHHAQAHHQYPHHGLAVYVHPHRVRHHQGPWHHERLPARLATARAFEYGVIPLGVRARDGFGNQSDLETTTVFINSQPRPAAASTLGEAAGRLRMTIEEWPDG